MQRINWWCASMLSAAIGIAGCGDLSPEDGSPSERSPALSLDREQEDASTIVPRIIFPDKTGSEINWVPSNPPTNPDYATKAQHYVWLPPAELRNGKLLVFLPGTGNRPFDYRYFSAEAARAGYRVIGLMYQNDTAIENVCPANATLNPPRPTNWDEDCSKKMRLEILTGVDPPAVISENVMVSVTNSIDYRLTKLLVYLEREFPHEGWGGFLVHGEPNWARIAVGGQSQGAGQAALIAQLRRVRRVVMLSGPPDSRIPNQVPPVVDSWVHVGATPASRHFALYHHKDRFVGGPPGTTGIPTNLAALGLDSFGPPAAVGSEGPYCTTDDIGPPSDWSFGQTHVLTTDLVPNGGCGGMNPGNPHRSTARDDFTPLAADGTPRLLGAWRYLIGASGQEDADEG
jgi:hypothetical protein